MAFILARLLQIGTRAHLPPSGAACARHGSSMVTSDHLARGRVGFTHTGKHEQQQAMDVKKLRGMGV